MGSRRAFRLPWTTINNKIDVCVLDCNAVARAWNGHE